MRHKGYEGVVTHVDDEANLMTGQITGLGRDGVMFQGRDAAELRKAFEESVDDYLEWAAKEAWEPEKPFSGTLNVRLAPDLHRRLAKEAHMSGKSLNSLIKDKLEDTTLPA